MAEFQEVARQWKRMCKKYWSTVTCHGCPIAEYEKAYEGCVTCETDVEKMEELVMTWATEHPEPVYPTWRDWLITKGLIDFKPDFRSLSYDPSLPLQENHVIECLSVKASEPIPAYIAESLGLEPKEEK